MKGEVVEFMTLSRIPFLEKSKVYLTGLKTRQKLITSFDAPNVAF